MKILPPEPHVDLYNEGFGEADLLQRKKVGQALSNLVDRIEDPAVIALDGGWGTGKTHFLKRWVGAHKIENDSSAVTVYFDAFSHDYLNDPLPALVAALTERLPKGYEAKARKLKAAAFKLAKPLARIGLAVATFGATEALSDLGDAAAEAASGEARDSLKNYWKEETGRREAMKEFKNAIEALAAPDKEEDIGSTIVIVIDELDRCRPDYALEVLEVIKHFFSVPHVHFILGVNLHALENSVQARYGINIDGHAYLKKFINITLNLPSELGSIHNSRPANLVYLAYLIKDMGVPTHIAKPLREQVTLVSKANEISMREIGKIVSSINLASDAALKKDNLLSGWILVMIDLVILKNVRPDLYPKFLNSTANDEDIISYFGATANNVTEIINGKPNDQFNRQIYWRYLTWRYVIGGKFSDDVDPHFKRSISEQFGMFGLDDDQNLPMTVHLEWLERFSFYAA